MLKRPSRLLIHVFTVCSSVVIAVSLCSFATSVFVRKAYQRHPLRETCRDAAGLHRRVDAPQKFYSCTERQAARFLAVDYTESKDLGKTFLTLLTALFVGSITFSEKIVNLKESGWFARGAMIVVWLLFLVAITACGFGLAFLATAAGQATYRPDVNYSLLEGEAVAMFSIAGLAFGAGLIAMLVAALLAMIEMPAAGSTSYRRRLRSRRSVATSR